MENCESFVCMVCRRRGEIYINTFSNIEEYKIIYNNIEYKILKFNMSDRKME